MAGVDVVLCAVAIPMVARQMTLLFKLAQRPANCPLPLSGFARYRVHRWPALEAFVICLIGKRKQDQLLTGRQVEIPYG